MFHLLPCTDSNPDEAVQEAILKQKNTKECERMNERIYKIK